MVLDAYIMMGIAEGIGWPGGIKICRYVVLELSILHSDFYC